MIKSNSDHVLRVNCDSAAVKIATTLVMANSSGNLILSACKRNSLCSCTENENNLNKIKQTSISEEIFDKQFENKENCTEHQTNENKKCKLIETSSDQSNMRLNNHLNNQQQNNQQQNNQQQNSQQNNPRNNSNNGRIYNQDNNVINNQQQQQNNDQNNENNDELNLNQFQMPNQLVDINNNIIEPELMLVDENNNLIGLPDANFDLNNNYLWNNDNLDQHQQQQQRRQDQNNQPNNSNDQHQQQQNERSTTNQQQQLNNHNLSLLKEKLNCTNLQSSVQLKQRKKLLELDLNKPRSSNQFYSTMNDEHNVIKEECNSSSSNHHYVFKRSSSSGRRKKSILCKKCLTKHLTKCDLNNNCKNENIKCEHYHSIDCATPDCLNESKKHGASFKKATTPLTLCPITTPTIEEQLNSDSENEINQTNKSSTNLESNTNLTTKTAQITSSQCPICLFILNDACKPNNCAHHFCSVCLVSFG